MAEQGKKIVFEGVDQTSNAAQAAKKNLIDIHDTNIKKTKEVNTVIQQGNDLLKEQLQLLEKQKQVIASMSSQGLTGAQAGAVGQITQKLFATPERVNPEHIRSFAKILEGMHLTGDPKGLSEKLIQKTQELIDTQKMLHKETMQHHLKDDELKGVSGGALKFLSQTRNVDRLNEKHFEGRLEKVQKEKEHLEKAIEKGDHGGGHLELPTSVESAIEQGLHKGLAMFGAGAAAGSIIELLKEGAEAFFKKEGILASAKSAQEVGFEISPLTGLPMSEIEKEMRHIPGKKRTFEAKNELDAQMFKYAAITGETANFGNASELGFSSAQLTEVGTQVAKNLGRSATHAEAYSSLFAEKVFGVNASGIESLSRYSKGEMDPKQIAASIADTFGSRVKTPEWAEALVKLSQQHLNVLGSIDSKSLLGTMASFSQNKNQLFQNAETLLPIMGGINQSLTSPKNNFAKARNFSVLSKLMPGASYFQIMRAMSKGTETKGYLEGTLETLSKQFGGDKEAMKIQLLSEGNLTPEQIEQFVEGYQPGQFLNTDQLVKNGGTAMSKAKSGVKAGLYSSRYTRDVAAIQSAYAISPEAGKEEVEKRLHDLNNKGMPEASAYEKETNKYIAQQAKLYNESNEQMKNNIRYAGEFGKQIEITAGQLEAFSKWLKKENNKNGAKHK